MMLEVRDHLGQEIREGTTLKYLGTRTQGKVEKICKKENNTWIKLDTTGLYYRLDYLMVIDPEVNPHKKTTRKSQKEKIIQKLKKTYNKNYEISSESDGPGVGGG